MGKSKKTALRRRISSSIKARLQPKHSASVIPFLYLTAANCWTMWNAYRQIAGMSLPSALTDWRAPSALPCITVHQLR